MTSRNQAIGGSAEAISGNVYRANGQPKEIRL